jgi:outer membrane receptor for monomeric catechols
MRHDSAIQTDGTRGVTPAAEIASKGLGNYMKLMAGVLFTITGTTNWLLVHGGSRKPSGFQNLAILPPTKLRPKKKLENAASESDCCT